MWIPIVALVSFALGSLVSLWFIRPISHTNEEKPYTIVKNDTSRMGFLRSLAATMKHIGLNNKYFIVLSWRDSLFPFAPTSHAYLFGTPKQILEQAMATLNIYQCNYKAKVWVTHNNDNDSNHSSTYVAH